MTVTNINEHRQKKCAKCEQFKPATNEFFHNDRTHSDGFRSQCRECRRTSDAVTRRTKQRKKEQLSIKAQASRHAILRLIKNHRSEFDQILKTELMVLTSRATPDAETKRVWINAG